MGVRIPVDSFAGAQSLARNGQSPPLIPNRVPTLVASSTSLKKAARVQAMWCSTDCHSRAPPLRDDRVELGGGQSGLGTFPRSNGTE